MNRTLKIILIILGWMVVVILILGANGFLGPTGNDVPPGYNGPDPYCQGRMQC